MAAAEEAQFSLKVMVIKGSNKVLYAEVDSDFADVLLSFLTLPLGTIVRLLMKHYGDSAPTLGSLNSLYAGLQDLDCGHFWTEVGKLMLLNPRNSSEIECRRLKLQIDDTPPIQYFMCDNLTCLSMYYDVKCLCPNSGNTMSQQSALEIETQSCDKGVFTAQTASFLLTDELQILANTSGTLFRILRLNGVEHSNELEERTMIVGLKEIMELLKGSLLSKTPITDIIPWNSSAAATLNKRKKFPVAAKFDIPQTQTSENISSYGKKIAVKALVQKSTSRVLLVQSRNDFIDFLFSLVTIPLGRVQFLLGNNACFGSINNLYGSISNREIVKYMKSKEAMAILLEPQIPPNYLSRYQIFSLNQQSSSVLYLPPENNDVRFGSTPSAPRPRKKMKMIDPKGQDSFVEGLTKHTIFMVTDDLVVSTTSSSSIMSSLKQMKIPQSDIMEQRLEIGMEEAIGILKASLTSTRALTEGLKPFLKTQPRE